MTSPVVSGQDADDIMAPACPMYKHGHTSDLSPDDYLYDNNTYIDLYGEATDNIGPGGADWQYCSILPDTSFYDMLYNPLDFFTGVELQNYLEYRLASELVKDVVDEESGPIKFVSDLYLQIS